MMTYAGLQWSATKNLDVAATAPVIKVGGTKLNGLGVVTTVTF